ncbi:hypothetical protein E3N88_09128 [Mikania micrantha]|uniref:DUF7081 domain-containing protein n=1 Tax=Mikania micrantha TaxID=192012 RepID=A0A5N6PIU4_9ASTR|nr:hypothetical protein E3N88_09128 [Mikania micrantha]
MCGRLALDMKNGLTLVSYAVKKAQNFIVIFGSMEIDPPHESDGSTNGSKESELNFVSDNHSGVGLPYAPEDFPKPGDQWGWKVGKRVTCSGHFVDRYLYLPNRLYNEYKSAYPTSMSNSRGFASKAAVKRFLLEAYPEMDIKAFFASFTWKIPAGRVKGNPDYSLDMNKVSIK